MQAKAGVLFGLPKFSPNEVTMFSLPRGENFFILKSCQEEKHQKQNQGKNMIDLWRV
jgi:hypothetical protein